MATRKSLEEIPCSIARSLDVIGEWWTPLVLRDVHYGLRRFEEIARDLPIARNVLSARLRSLVEAGVLERRQYASGPDRYEYHLTERGHDTFGVILALMAWGDRWTGEPEAASPPVSVLCRGCNAETTPVVACAHCGDELTARHVGVRPNHGQQVPRARLALRRAGRD